MKPARLVPVLLALVLAAACGSSGSAAPAGAGSAPSGRLVVLAAASLTGTFTELARTFEADHPGTDVVLSFGGSSALAQQVLSGAPADVFASASSKDMDRVVEAGDASAPQVFAQNQAEVAVALPSVGRVTSLADLGRKDVTVALCQPEVPCGVLATKVLDSAGVQVTPVTRGLDVKAVLAAVSSGEVDAGIVYATDVLAAKGKVEGVPVPDAAAARTAYPVAATSTGKNPTLAAAFVDFLLTPPAQAVLTRAGFTSP